MCNSLKFVSEASHLNLLFVGVLSLYLLCIYTATFHCFVILKFSVVSHLKCRSTLSLTIYVDLHLRWLATENFKIAKQSKVAVFLVKKISSKHKKNYVKVARFS